MHSAALKASKQLHNISRVNLRLNPLLPTNDNPLHSQSKIITTSSRHSRGHFLFFQLKKAEFPLVPIHQKMLVQNQ